MCSNFIYSLFHTKNSSKSVEVHIWRTLTKFILTLQGGKRGVGKRVAPAPLAVKKEAPKKVVNPLIEKKPRNYGIGKYFCLPDLSEMY